MYLPWKSLSDRRSCRTPRINFSTGLASWFDMHSGWEQIHTQKIMFSYKTYLSEVEVGMRICWEFEFCQQLRVSALQQLVEDVEIPLPWCLMHHSGLLQQVVVDVATNWSSLDKETCTHHIQITEPSQIYTWLYRDGIHNVHHVRRYTCNNSYYWFTQRHNNASSGVYIQIIMPRHVGVDWR